MSAHGSSRPAPSPGTAIAMRYALIPVDGTGITVATVERMLDGGDGATARILAPGGHLPYGVEPVLLTTTTVYGMTRVEQALRSWGPRPRPWLVLAADAPVRPVAGVRYLARALEQRLAGVVHLPYLAVLREVRGPAEALEHKDVIAAAEQLRRTIKGE
ncbi:hypothetical protein [Streptomyces sp. NPDC047097]|uniref:hypothetical protein n=1 Tax=Streptomyces sp. NPDC047097 TaxID=3155260 RepID=UPI0033FEA32C